MARSFLPKLIGSGKRARTSFTQQTSQPWIEKRPLPFPAFSSSASGGNSSEPEAAPLAALQASIASCCFPTWQNLLPSLKPNKTKKSENKGSVTHCESSTRCCIAIDSPRCAFLASTENPWLPALFPPLTAAATTLLLHAPWLRSRLLL